MPTVHKTSWPWVKTKPSKAAPNQGRAERNRDVYDTQRWRNIRKLHLQQHPLCVTCKEKGIPTPAKVLDHIVPINKGGDPWDSSNHQGMCESCHNTKSINERHGK